MWYILKTSVLKTKLKPWIRYPRDVNTTKRKTIRQPWRFSQRRVHSIFSSPRYNFTLYVKNGVSESKLLLVMNQRHRAYSLAGNPGQHRSYTAHSAWSSCCHIWETGWAPVSIERCERHDCFEARASEGIRCPYEAFLDKIMFACRAWLIMSGIFEMRQGSAAYREGDSCSADLWERIG